MKTVRLFYESCSTVRWLRARRYLGSLSACVLGIVGLSSPQAFPQARDTRGTTLRQTPQAVRDGTASLVAPYSPSQMLRLVFGLQPPHLAEEQQFLQDLHTKGSPVFHQFLTADEWNARFAPAAADEQAVVDWANAQGLTITHRYPNRLLVDVEAPVATIMQALQITINTYQASGTTFFSNDQDPTIPANLARIIHSVGGLNNLQVLHPARKEATDPVMPVYSPGPVVQLGPSGGTNGDRNALARAMADRHTRTTQPAITDGYYDPTDIYSSQAYNLNALNNLEHCCNPFGNPDSSPPDASIAIATAGAQDTNDFLGFHDQYSYLAEHWDLIGIDGQHVPCNPATMACDFEGTMDFEWSTAMANSFGSENDTAMVYMYDGANTLLSTFTDVYNQILNDGYARVFSTSWGCAETPYCYDAPTMDTDDAIFSQMVGEGWTLVAASDDNGATAKGGSGKCVAADAVQFPASDPDVIAAGGTTLFLNFDGTYNSEIAWIGGTGSGSCNENDGGSGGGISNYYGTPYYQEGMPGNTGRRTLPDLALNADYFQNLYFGGTLQGNGGTSIVAPELAGFFAQENAYLLYVSNIVGTTCGGTATYPCAPMGNANYYIYYEGLNTPYAAHYPFYDITYGCNSNDVTAAYSLPYYCAGVGYDKVSGWGSANLLQLAWAINTYLAADFSAPTVNFSRTADQSLVQLRPNHILDHNRHLGEWSSAKRSRGLHRGLGLRFSGFLQPGYARSRRWFL